LTTPQTRRIFISYRRADSAGYAISIYDRFAKHFGKDAIFMDVDTIEAGLDFVEVLENAVQSCEVLVALIGKQWLNIKDEDGKRRLDNPQDFVRIEVATALKRGIRVIPVLIDGTPMPNSDQLPSNLESLSRRNAVPVNLHSFDDDADRLIRQLKLALDAREQRETEGDERFASEEAAEKATRKKVEREATEDSRYEKEERESAEKIVDHKNIGQGDIVKIEWINIPAGKHLSGTVDEESLEAFQIGKYPVTNEQFSAFVQATEFRTIAEEKGSSYLYQQGKDSYVVGANWKHPLGPESNLDGKEKHPVVHVSWNDANEFCKWANCRLPTESEWDRAARGDHEYTYPWRNDWVIGKYANSIESSIGGTTPVNQYPQGVSYYGVYDMGGNVWEWMKDLIIKDKTTGILRGGSWGNSSDYLKVSYRFHCFPELTDNRIGFRCARSIDS